MKTYVVEVERTERDSFALTVPALPGLLILGLSIDEVLERAWAAIEFYAAADVHDRPAQLEVALSPARGLSGLSATFGTGRVKPAQLRRETTRPRSTWKVNGAS